MLPFLSYLQFVRKLMKIVFLVTFDSFIGKTIYHRKHPKYDDFIIIGAVPKKHSIDSSFQSEKKNLTENTLYMNSHQTQFSKEILKNA